VVKRISSRSVVPILVACAFLLLSFPEGGWQFSAADKVRVSTVCLDCHTGQDSTLMGTAHRLKEGALEGPEAKIACTDCHIGDPRHWEEDPATYPMYNPSKVGARAEAKLCSTCHTNSHQQNMIERNVHTVNDVNCSGCHAVHKSTHAALLKQSESALCLSCHSGVEGQFAKPYRHPVSDGVIRCSECHLSLDETKRELSLNGTNVCLKCHGEFEGPFPYEHQATVDYSTEEGGCITCHAPHGSSFPRMLNQPYEPPHYQLCSQCHSVPRHNSNSMHGTTWSGVACNDCHTDIHGSYTSRFFLSASLEGEGCFNSGCHQY
jgi:DmsE family decaheme c-type cytochrome